MAGSMCMKNIFAIAEPYQWQEVISYLIVGDKQAILFDTGNGIADIKAVVDKLTTKDIIVINSHGHEDHVGGNYQFTRVMAIANDFTRQKSLGTPTNEYLQGEVSAEALCKPLAKPIENHHIKAFTISDTVANHHKLDIGGRVLELIQMPGHTPDSVVMIDRAAGFMWTGDSYYPGQIWLYEPETDYLAYRQSIGQMAAIAQPFTQLFPAHNVPKAPAQVLTKVRDAYEGILKGNDDYRSPESGKIVYEFAGFSFLLSDRILINRKQIK